MSHARTWGPPPCTSAVISLDGTRRGPNAVGRLLSRPLLPARIVQGEHSASRALRVATRWPAATLDPEHSPFGTGAGEVKPGDRGSPIFAPRSPSAGGGAVTMTSQNH